MKHQSNKYLMFGWRVRSLFLIFAVANKGEPQLVHDRLQKKDSRVNPAYLNPELYREEIASLVNAKERAEELLFKNDLIAQLVTETPYHYIQNRLLISGNHKEVNRSFFEKLPERKNQWNCGKGFDIYKLLNVVQKSRERAENLTQYYGLTTTANSNRKNKATCTSTNTSDPVATTTSSETTSTKCTMVELPSFVYGGASVAYLPTQQVDLPSSQNLPISQMQMHMRNPSTETYYEKFNKQLPLNKSPAGLEMDAPISSATLSQGSDDHLLMQPREYKPPMLIPILEKSYVPYPLKYLPKVIDIESSRVGIRESNDNSVSESGYRHFKNVFINPKSRS